MSNSKNTTNAKIQKGHRPFGYAGVLLLAVLNLNVSLVSFSNAANLNGQNQSDLIGTRTPPIIIERVEGCENCAGK